MLRFLFDYICIPAHVAGKRVIIYGELHCLGTKIPSCHL